ncbi:MAG TPA: PRC-barrel domain-containing protein [Acetobacteraceae bacterium]|nr:PRC-barrel domain-containing protein [Acetobacteraceae bacterium]
MIKTALIVALLSTGLISPALADTAPPPAYAGTATVSSEQHSGTDSGTAANLLASEAGKGGSGANNTNANNHQAAKQLPSQRNNLLSDNGDVRIAKLIGTTVFSSDDKKLGHVEDVLMGRSGEPQVILTVAGSDKQVALSWNKLEFGNSRKDSDNAVILPGVTRAALNGLPTFRYHQGKSG